MKRLLALSVLLLTIPCFGQHVTLNVLVGGGPISSDVTTYLLNNPVVDGATIQTSWADFDKADGSNTVDFSTVDARVAPWKAAGKKANLVLWAVSDNAAPTCSNAFGLSGTGDCAIPAAIWTKLGSANYTTCTNQYGTQRVPNYLDATDFQVPYQHALSLLTAHFASEPAVGYVRPGLGHGGEDYPGAGWNDPNTPCGQAYARWGTTIATWETYLHNMLTADAALMNGKQQMTGMVPMGVPGNTVPDYIASVAGPLNVGIGSQGWQKSDEGNCAGAVADWCNLFANPSYSSIPHELQTYLQTCGDNSCQTGALPGLLTWATAHGATILEIYQADWLTAFDPNYTGYSQYGAVYAAALKAVNNGAPAAPTSFTATPH